MWDGRLNWKRYWKRYWIFNPIVRCKKNSIQKFQMNGIWLRLRAQKCSRKYFRANQQIISESQISSSAFFFQGGKGKKPFLSVERIILPAMLLSRLLCCRHLQNVEPPCRISYFYCLPFKPQKLVHSVLVIGTLVNGTFVIRTKFSPHYPDTR